MRALALDFDGVVSDSAPEAYVVALRTYVALSGDGLAADLMAAEAASPAALRSHPLYRGFVERMPLGNRAEDFGVVLGTLEGHHEVPDQAAYDAARDARPPGFLDAFHQRFYLERERFRQGDRARWRSLLGPYPRFVEMLRQRPDDLVLAIATAKDRASVIQLLEDYGIADLFDASLVLDKETGVHKRAHLEELRRRLGTRFTDITFVDDKVNHLTDVAPLGVRCCLAGWGYNGPREWQRAHAAGFRVVDLETARAELFGAGPSPATDV